MPFSRTLFLFAAGAALVRAADDQPVVLDPFQVSDTLDRAREDIAPSLGAASYQLDKSQLLAQPMGLSANFNDVLIRIPAVAQDSFGQVHLRGEHANLQYRINDVLLPEGIAGFGQELDVPFIKTANVLTGSLPAQYGYRTAGVVDIHTQSGAELGDQGSVSIVGGSHDTVRSSVDTAGVQGPLSGFVTASAETNDLGIENPTASREAIHDRTREVKAFADLDYVFDPSSRLTLLLGSSAQRFQIPNSPDQTPAFVVNGRGEFDSAALDENQGEFNDYAILAYQKTGPVFSYQASAFTRYSLTHFTPDVVGDLIFNGTASDVHQDLISDGTELDAKWNLAEKHTLRGGLIALASNANTKTNTAVLPTNAAGDQTSQVPFWISDDHHKLGVIAGVYAQDEWKPVESLTVNYGLRADESQSYLHEGQLSPRVNLVEQLTDNTSLHAGYSRYFTPPPVELSATPDLAKFAGTTHAPEVTTASPVRSERADYWDAGVSQQVLPGLSVTLDSYYKRATDQLDEGQFGAAMINAAFNYAVGHIYGAEFSANYAKGGFSAYTNAAVGHADGNTIVSGQYEFGADELAYIASHEVLLDHDQSLTASAGSSYRWSGNLVYVDFLYGSGLRSGFANTDHVGEHHPLNLGGEHTFTWDKRHALTVRLDLANVFDEVYQLRSGSGIGVFAPQYGARRGIFASVTETF